MNTSHIHKHYVVCSDHYDQSCAILVSWDTIVILFIILIWVLYYILYYVYIYI